MFRPILHLNYVKFATLLAVSDVKATKLNFKDKATRVTDLDEVVVDHVQKIEIAYRSLFQSMFKI